MTRCPANTTRYVDIRCGEITYRVHCMNSLINPFAFPDFYIENRFDSLDFREMWLHASYANLFRTVE